MKTRIRLLYIVLLLGLLLAACVRTESKPAQEQDVAAVTAQPTDAAADTVTITVTAAPVAETEVPVQQTEEPAATPEPTAEPTDTPEPTPEPTPSPVPTRAPRADDIATVNFPDYDTGVDADYSYQSDELRIAIKVHHESMPDQNGRMLKETYYVADIWMRSLNSFRTAFARGEYNTGSEEGDALAKRENAILAVNGSYNQGLTLHAGVRYKGLRENKGWNSGSACLIYKDGSMKTFQLKKETLNINAEIKNGAWHGWQFGPIIIRDYEKGSNATSYSTMGFKARNMLGYYEPGHYVIVTCDNRGDDARGMNEYMMVDVMKSLGVKDAFNLDGGVSAVMVFMGEVINSPTPHISNGVKEDGRPIVDMLLFGEYDENGNSADLSTLTASKFFTPAE